MENNESYNENRENAPKENGASGQEQNERKNDEPIIDSSAAKKVIYSLCYLWGILFFLPLILYKDDPASTKHANEGLVLLLFSVIGNAVFGILSAIGGFVGKMFGIIAGVYSLLLLILGILGIIYVVTDKDEPLPILGTIKILK